MEVEINGHPVHYKVIGEGKPVVCLHGFPEDHEVMLNCIEPAFAELEGFQRIYLDLPGMGLSAVNENLTNADRMLEIVQQFIQRIIGDRSYLLIGQSYGGYLSLGLSFLSPRAIDGLFLLCPCVVANRINRNLPLRQLMEKSDSLEVAVPDYEKKIYSEFLEMAVVATEYTWERYKKEILPGLLRADEGFVQRYQDTGYELSFETNFRDISFDKPVTFLTGRQDDCVGYKDAFELLDSFSRASFLTVDYAGHNLQIEQPKQFLEVLTTWINHFT